MNLRARLYTLSFVDEFGPLYALYTLWFSDNGITTVQLSTVFTLWAVVAVVLEVPSGAVADRVDRRRLLAFAFVLRAIGISLWLVYPTYTMVLIGAALWAIHSSLASGAWEAHIHDQLAAIGEASTYGPTMARVGQFSHAGVALGTLVASAALQLGASIEAMGWLTVAIHAVSISLVLRLPNVDHSDDGDEDESGAGAVAEWWSTLRAGTREAFSSVPIIRLVLLGMFIEGLFIVDEYVPLIARFQGASDTVVPILVFAVWLGLLAGGEVVARRPSAQPRWLGGALVVGAAAMLAGVAGSNYWFLALVAVGYGAMEALLVVADARLQERISSDHRATVTSVRSLFAALISGIGFVVIGALSDGDDPARGVALVCVALIALGVAAVRWLPAAQPNPRPSRS